MRVQTANQGGAGLEPLFTGQIGLNFRHHLHLFCTSQPLLFSFIAMLSMPDLRQNDRRIENTIRFAE